MLTFGLTFFYRLYCNFCLPNFLLFLCSIRSFHLISLAGGFESFNPKLVSILYEERFILNIYGFDF